MHNIQYLEFIVNEYFNKTGDQYILTMEEKQG